MAQPSVEVEVLDVPGDVHDDILEAYLLLNCACNLFIELHGTSPAPHIGMYSINDLVQWATEQLESPQKERFLGYAVELSRVFACRAHPILPVPSQECVEKASAAEALARSLLAEGVCPVWSAARQVAGLLCHELPRHKHMTMQDNAASFTVGAFSSGPHHGLCRSTMAHPNTARLLNCLVVHLCPHHRWTTLAVLFNYATQPHIDRCNGPSPNLVISLSLHEGGEIWIAHAQGCEYLEHQGRMVRGDRFLNLLQAVRFPAHRLLHHTCAWQHFDRVTLVAYTAERWEKLGLPMHQRLEEMGFVLPDPAQPIVQPSIMQDCLPCVLRH